RVRRWHRQPVRLYRHQHLVRRHLRRLGHGDNLSCKGGNSRRAGDSEDRGALTTSLQVRGGFVRGAFYTPRRKVCPRCEAAGLSPAVVAWRLPPERWWRLRFCWWVVHVPASGG